MTNSVSIVLLPPRSRASRQAVAPIVLLAFAFGVVPFVADSYVLEAILTPFLILSLAGLGLNVLTGYAGQLSLGTAAFMAVGAYTAYNLTLRIGGMPIPMAIVLAGFATALVGLAFGLPSLRLRGFYLAVSTLAAQFFVPWVITRFSWISNESPSGVIDAPPLHILGVSFDSPAGRYAFTLAIVTILTWLLTRLVRSETGHDFVAVKDNELAARILGVPVLRTKLLAFAVSSFVIGVAGALWAFVFLRTVEPAGFNLDRSFQVLFIVIIGGLASIRGAFLGAALIVTAPVALSRIGAAVLGDRFDSGVLDMSQRVLLGVLILAFLIAEPRGLSALWDRLSRRARAAVGGHETNDHQS